jgi:hypothetical protein
MGLQCMYKGAYTHRNGNCKVKCILTGRHHFRALWILSGNGLVLSCLVRWSLPLPSYTLCPVPMTNNSYLIQENWLGLSWVKYALQEAHICFSVSLHFLNCWGGIFVSPELCSAFFSQMELSIGPGLQCMYVSPICAFLFLYPTLSTCRCNPILLLLLRSPLVVLFLLPCVLSSPPPCPHLFDTVQVLIEAITAAGRVVTSPTPHPLPHPKPQFHRLAQEE